MAPVGMAMVLVQSLVVHSVSLQRCLGLLMVRKSAIPLRPTLLDLTNQQPGLEGQRQRLLEIAMVVRQTPLQVLGVIV